jgi:hypothetical protein
MIWAKICMFENMKCVIDLCTVLPALGLYWHITPRLDFFLLYSDLPSTLDPSPEVTPLYNVKRAWRHYHKNMKICGISEYSDEDKSSHIFLGIARRSADLRVYILVSLAWYFPRKLYFLCNSFFIVFLLWFRISSLFRTVLNMRKFIPWCYIDTVYYFLAKINKINNLFSVLFYVRYFFFSLHKSWV